MTHDLSFQDQPEFDCEFQQEPQRSGITLSHVNTGMIAVVFLICVVNAINVMQCRDWIRRAHAHILKLEKDSAEMKRFRADQLGLIVPPLPEDGE